MRRAACGWASCLSLLVVLSGVELRAQTPAELAQTAAYVAAFQNPDGGFAAKPGGRSSLGSTSSAIRSLKYAGGSVRDVPACVAFVRKCYDAETGGFAPMPGGTPDVATTAVGLMAVSELKIPAEEIADKAVAFFSKHAKSFEEIRIAVAGLEAVNKASPDFPAWIKQVNSDRNADGTWGRGDGRAFATGGAAVALLRMGVTLEDKEKEAILDAMRSGQNPDGGWSRSGRESNLPDTYRVMRAFFMLKAEPDLDRVRRLIARCRRSDGGYATTPGGGAELGGCYYATIITRWTRLLTGEPPVVETAAFVPLFNGKDLTGWEGDTSLWQARDGMLVGRSPGIKNNEFLATDRSYRDFALKLTFRMVDGRGNSGVQFRSERIPGHEMKGYQADLGERYWGCLYDESRRNRVLANAAPKALESLRKSGWNQYEVRAMGDRIRLMLNGVTSVDYREQDPDIAPDGRIAVQIHAGGPMEVQFKDIYIQALPSPKADRSDSPGFHLRTLQTGGGERKYTLFLPAGYDGRKQYPVVLFLHGAGERGDDGVVPAQVGIGPAILQNPGAYPCIVVFPQARRTWAADSDDAEAALATLDEVLKTYKVDRSRVVLTGLSMGGAGTWSIAAAHPGRFSAIVPICGRGKVDDVAKLKGLPVWGFVGDADRDATVLNLREMVAALETAGADPKETEYRGVGHNSWDRAYTDRDLIDWMLAQRRRDAPNP